jgi:hypothetical protein
VDDAAIEAIARDKLKELWEGWGWSFRSGNSILATVAPKVAGTMSLNVDPTKVDGVGTAFTASDVGDDLRVQNGNTRYAVSAVNVSTQQLTLASPYVGAVFTAASYILQRSVYPLAADFGAAFQPSYWRPLGEMSQKSIDIYDARRSFTSQSPYGFTYRGIDSAGVPQVEITPVPSVALGIHYRYKKALPTLEDATRIDFSEPSVVYLCAADALAVKAMELAEKNGGAAQLLMAQADKYQALGQVALEEFRYQDLLVSGASQAVRDEAVGGGYSDDYLLAHDLYSPIR